MSNYKSVCELMADNPNLMEYIGQLERERDELVSFVREQMELYKAMGDSGAPIHEQGARIVEMYKDLRLVK